MRKPRHLTTREKRDFMARIVRDKDGEFSLAEKFKAIVEDTRLAQLDAAAAKEEAEAAAAEAAAARTPHPEGSILEQLDTLLPPPLPME